MDHLRSGVQDQPDQYDETPSLQKVQKLAGHDGRHLWSQLLGRLRQENYFNLRGRGCSELRLCHCTPAWRLATERDPYIFLKKFSFSNCPLPHYQLKIGQWVYSLAIGRKWCREGETYLASSFTGYICETQSCCVATVHSRSLLWRLSINIYNMFIRFTANERSVCPQALARWHCYDTHICLYMSLGAHVRSFPKWLYQFIHSH